MRTPCIDMRNIETISQNHKCKIDTDASRNRSRVARRRQSVPRPACGGAMLTLLRLPFLAGLATREWSPLALRPYASFLREKLWGSAPRAHQGEAPANAGADLGRLPGPPRFSSFPIFEWSGTRLCRPARASRPTRAGDPPRPESPWRLLPPVSPTGRGAGARCALRPRKKEINNVGQIC